MLSLQTNASRTVINLNGFWDFKLDADDEGKDAHWEDGRLYAARPMPVPSSFNDVTLDIDTHRHVGPVWYQRNITIPRTLDDERIILRFDGLSHPSDIYLDTTLVAQAVGAELACEADITDLVQAGQSARITVRMDCSEITGKTFPPGSVYELHEDARRNTVYYNSTAAAGIHQNVSIYTRPATAISDISWRTISLLPRTGGGFESAEVEYAITLDGKHADSTEVSVVLKDFTNTTVVQAQGASGKLTVENPQLWSPQVPYLYTLHVTAGDDVYEQKVGIRTLMIVEQELHLNGEPLALRGFSLTKDAPIRLKGADYVLSAHDFEVMKWMGANCYLPSAHPLTPEELDLADKVGLLVLAEMPVYGTDPRLARTAHQYEALNAEERVAIQTGAKELHEQIVSEVIARDKNHPCIIAWSVAHHPQSDSDETGAYLTSIMDHARQADPSHRPVTFTASMLSTIDRCKALRACDLLLLSRSYGWDISTGELEASGMYLNEELTDLESSMSKPTIVILRSACAQQGSRSLYEDAWSEDFQVSQLAYLGSVIDSHPSVMGELVNSLYDYAPHTSTPALGDGFEGLFTRSREPKTAAFVLRARWLLNIH